MGLMFRRRRPVARLAVGAATAGVAYHAGKKAGQGPQEAAPQEAAPQQQEPAQPYVPPSAGTDVNDELTRLVQLHDAGNLTDEEFAAAKAKVLGS